MSDSPTPPFRRLKRRLGIPSRLSPPEVLQFVDAFLRHYPEHPELLLFRVQFLKAYPHLAPEAPPRGLYRQVVEAARKRGGVRRRRVFDDSEQQVLANSRRFVSSLTKSILLLLLPLLPFFWLLLEPAQNGSTGGSQQAAAIRNLLAIKQAVRQELIASQVPRSFDEDPPLAGSLAKREPANPSEPTGAQGSAGSATGEEDGTGKTSGAQAGGKKAAGGKDGAEKTPGAQAGVKAGGKDDAGKTPGAQAGVKAGGKDDAGKTPGAQTGVKAGGKDDAGKTPGAQAGVKAGGQAKPEEPAQKDGEPATAGAVQTAAKPVEEPAAPTYTPFWQQFLASRLAQINDGADNSDGSFPLDTDSAYAYFSKTNHPAFAAGNKRFSTLPWAFDSLENFETAAKKCYTPLTSCTMDQIPHLPGPIRHSISSFMTFQGEYLGEHGKCDAMARSSEAFSRTHGWRLTESQSKYYHDSQLSDCYKEINNTTMSMKHLSDSICAFPPLGLLKYHQHMTNDATENKPTKGKMDDTRFNLTCIVMVAMDNSVNGIPYLQFMSAIHMTSAADKFLLLPDDADSALAAYEQARIIIQTGADLPSESSQHRIQSKETLSYIDLGLMLTHMVRGDPLENILANYQSFMDNPHHDLDDEIVATALSGLALVAAGDLRQASARWRKGAQLMTVANDFECTRHAAPLGKYYENQAKRLPKALRISHPTVLASIGCSDKISQEERSSLLLVAAKALEALH